MHNAAFRELGLDDWRYEAIDVEPERFAEVVRGMAAQGYAGANVTIPHKLRALEVADTATEVATAVGAANTLVFDRRRRPRRQHGRGGLPHRAARARARGARAACGRWCWARAAPGGPSSTRCSRRGRPRVEVWNRHPERAAALVADLSGRGRHRAGGNRRRRTLDRTDLLVNATSVGMVSPGSDPSMHGECRPHQGATAIGR